MTINEKYQQARQNGATMLEPEAPKADPMPSAPVYDRASRNNKGWLYGLITIAIILVLAAVSCPKELEHRTVVTPVVTEVIKQNVNGLAGSFGLDMKEVEQSGVAQFFYESLVGGQVQEMMTNNFFVSNHIIYSKGYIMSGDQAFCISFGCFGHVFTLGRLEGRFANGIDLN